jgi:hypothetical protein
MHFGQPVPALAKPGSRVGRSGQLRSRRAQPSKQQRDAPRSNLSKQKTTHQNQIFD